MQNTIQKFRQSSNIFQKPGILSENLKTLTSSKYPTVQYIFAHLFNLPISTKEPCITTEECVLWKKSSETLNKIFEKHLKIL